MSVSSFQTLCGMRSRCGLIVKKTIEFMFAGINVILALRRAQNIFMSKNINCITIITLEGIEKIKTEK